MFCTHFHSVWSFWYRDLLLKFFNASRLTCTERVFLPPLSEMISGRATVYTRFSRCRFHAAANPFSAFPAETFSAAHTSGVRPRDEWPGFLHKGRAQPGGAGCRSARTSISELSGRTAALTFRRAWEKSGRPIIFRYDDDNRRSRSKFASHAAWNTEKGRTSENCIDLEQIALRIW